LFYVFLVVLVAHGTARPVRRSNHINHTMKLQQMARDLEEDLVDEKVEKITQKEVLENESKGDSDHEANEHRDAEEIPDNEQAPKSSDVKEQSDDDDGAMYDGMEGEFEESDVFDHDDEIEEQTQNPKSLEEEEGNTAINTGAADVGNDDSDSLPDTFDSQYDAKSQTTKTSDDSSASSTVANTPQSDTLADLEKATIEDSRFTDLSKEVEDMQQTVTSLKSKIRSLKADAIKVEPQQSTATEEEKEDQGSWFGQMFM